MKVTILLTGATGFIGERVLKLLLKRDINLVVVVRKNSLKFPLNIRSRDKIILTDDLFLEDESWWGEVCLGVDIILHLAWFTEHKTYLESQRNIDCLHGSINLAKGAVKAGVKKFIAIGTCLEYQNSNEQLTIFSPLKPESLYAKCKAELYNYLKIYFYNSKISFTWCRLFFIYGEGEPPGKLHSYVKNSLMLKKNILLDDGDAVRDYLDVGIAAKKIVNASMGEFQGPLNICSGQGLVISELVYSIALSMGADKSLINFKNRNINPQKIWGVPSL